MRTVHSLQHERSVINNRTTDARAAHDYYAVLDDMLCPLPQPLLLGVNGALQRKVSDAVAAAWAERPRAMEPLVGSSSLSQG